MSNKDVKTSEEDFQQQIIDLAHFCGWRIAHFRPARTKYGWSTAVAGDGKGFPDCVMVRGHRLIFAELKSEKGKMSDAQLEWYLALNLLSGSSAGHVSVYIWRPSDFEEIVKCLR